MATIYRVRKSWNDPASQVGAFSIWDNAKACCNKHKGYSIFDDKGKVLYSNGAPVIKKNQTITTAFNSFTFANSKKTKNLGAKTSSGLGLTYSSDNTKIATVDKNGVVTSVGAGTAIITIKQAGNANYNSASKVVKVIVPKWKTYAQIVEPVYQAAVAQAKQQQNYTYAWKGAAKQTIADSKKYGTCVTYANCILYRLGILREKTYLYQNAKGTPEFGGATSALTKDAAARGKKYLSINRVKNIAPIKLKSKLRRGDILMYTTGTTKAGSGNHICVFTGEFSGNSAIVWDNNWAKKKMKSKILFNKPLDSYTRIRHFEIYTECTDGVITTSNDYLAAQTVKISYKPLSGKTLKSITVDGKAVDIKKYPSSYTFSSLSANHTIVVTYK